MDAGSIFSKGFTDDDDEEDGYGKEDGVMQKDLTVVDGKNNERKPSTPRSKHSATEQRRRSRINDRFQILRDLIPHSDQKRDKASFLLEVIEYVQFLQEKVQKYESEFPGLNQDTTNMMPWVKVFFRTFWENARQRNSRVQIDGVADPYQDITNGCSPIGCVKSANSTVPSSTELDDAGASNIGKAIPVAVAMQQTGLSTGFPQMQQINESANVSCPSQQQCLRADMGNDQILIEDSPIDECMLNMSTAYSQRVANALAQSLQNFGIDVSHTSVAVDISLRRTSFTGPASASMEHGGLCDNQASRHSRSGSSGEESDRAHKRQRR